MRSSCGREAAVKLLPISANSLAELDSYRQVCPHPHIIDVAFSFTDRYACHVRFSPPIHATTCVGSACMRGRDAYLLQCSAFARCVPRRFSINIGFEMCQMDMFTHVVEEGALSDADAKPFVRQLLSAVAHVHACGIVHCDIKLENMLLDQNGHLKLCDFGLATVAPVGCRLRSSRCGTSNYAAPESIFAIEYDGRAADMWSVGVSVFCMTRGRFPFLVTKMHDLYQAYVKRPSPIEVPCVIFTARTGIALPLLQLLDACITFDATRRPSAAELQYFSWLQDDYTTPGRISGSKRPRHSGEH